MNMLARIPNEDQTPANILCLDQFSNIGGGQRSLLDMLPAFSERGWRPSVAVTGEGAFTALVRSRGYRTHVLACDVYASRRKSLVQQLKYAFRLPGLVDAVADLVERNETDLIYVNGPRLVPPAAWVAWRKGVPLVFHCHNRLLQHSAIALTGQALELASAHVIACCQYAADPLREYVAPDRLSILYNGVADTGISGLRSRAGIQRIGAVGRVEQGKGQVEFVQAARLVSRECPEIRFAVIGSPMFTGARYYRKVVASSNGVPIEFIDWRDDTATIYSDLDMLIVPSGPLEATTRVILEAYSAGVPVVAFPSGGIPEILEDNRTGFLTEAPTAEALARRIMSVLQMRKPNLQAVIRRARREWRQRFTLGAYQDGVCDVVAQAMQPNLRAWRVTEECSRIPRLELQGASTGKGATYSG